MLIKSRILTTIKKTTLPAIIPRQKTSVGHDNLPTGN